MLDFESAEHREDPSRTFRALLDAGERAVPVRGMRAFLILRYADCLALLNDHRAGFESVEDLSKAPLDLQGYFEMRQRLMLFQNPPQHALTRAAGVKALRQCPLMDLEKAMRTRARSLLQGFEKGDFIAEVARPYVAQAVVDVLALRDLDLKRVTDLSQALADSLDPCSPLNDRQAAGGQYLALKKEVQDSAHGEIETATLVMLVAAGLQTTGHILGTAVRRLVETGEKVSPQYIEECYRYDSPAQMTRRIVRERMKLAGRDFQPGTVLWCGIAAGNRDQAVFEQPERFLAQRQPNRHLAFGSGSHACIGATLARRQLKTFLEEFQNYQWKLEGGESWNGNLVFRGLSALPMSRKPETGG